MHVNINIDFEIILYFCYNLKFILNLSSYYFLIKQAFQREYTWEEIFVEVFNLFRKEKELSQLLQAQKRVLKFPF